MANDRPRGFDESPEMIFMKASPTIKNIRVAVVQSDSFSWNPSEPRIYSESDFVDYIECRERCQDGGFRVTEHVNEMRWRRGVKSIERLLRTARGVKKGRSGDVRTGFQSKFILSIWMSVLVLQLVMKAATWDGSTAASSRMPRASIEWATTKVSQTSAGKAEIPGMPYIET